MNRHVICPHGHQLLVEAGREIVLCPRCGVLLGGDVPASARIDLAMAARAARRSSRDDDDDDDEDEPPRRKRRARVKDDEDDDKIAAGRPRRKRPVAREEEEEEEVGGEIKLSRKQRQMNLVRNGIMCHIIKLWIYMIALLASFAFLPIMLFAAAVGLGALVGILFILMLVFSMLLAPLLGIIGSILCCFVPPKSEARGTIYVSLALDCLAPLLGVAFIFIWFTYAVTDDTRMSRLATLIGVSSVACTLVAWWMFMIYLRKLAFYLRETLLASEALNILTHLIVSCVLGPVLVVLVFLLPFPLILFLMLVGWLIYFIISFPIRMFRMLFTMRTKIYEKYLKPDDDDDLVPAYGT